MTRVVARWVPKLSSEEQKRERVKCSSDLLKSWRSEKDFLDCIATGDESWFHYYEPESKFQSSQWKKKHEAVPIKGKCAPSAGKRMLFWDRKGILSIDWLPEKCTINSDYYIRELEELRDVIKRERRGKLTRGILLQHDNARPHISSRTNDAIRRLGFECLPHPPYSLDVVPSDYWLFGEMKNRSVAKDLANLKTWKGV